ncbi:MAG: hypothetical protein L6262_11115 [Weeksellaceae bacterium]|nr:hypothetical protein [Weeksellaceae bacterium]
MNTIDERLNEAKKLCDDEKYIEAIDLFLSIENLNPRQQKFQMLFLAYSYFSTDNFEKSLYYANLLSNKKTSSEMASQLKYLSLVKLDRVDDAILEIINFLNAYPANLYKITLEELLEDIERNTIDIKFANKILYLAKKNNVEI